MTLIDALLLATAAFAGGGINAVAGGGSLVSFPALLAVGYPAKVANVTNTVALWPGYIGGSVGYRSLLVPQQRTILALTPASVLGAITGAAILLVTSEASFKAIVPYLILFASVLLTFQPQLSRIVLRARALRATAIVEPDGGRIGLGTAVARRIPLDVHPAVFLLAVYGAYFGAGLGTLTLAVLGILLPDDLQRSNALKGMLSLVINAVAVIYFAILGHHIVQWAPAAIMAVAGLAGGYLGVHVAKRLSARILRYVVVAYSLAVAVVLFSR